MIYRRITVIKLQLIFNGILFFLNLTDTFEILNRFNTKIQIQTLFIRLNSNGKFPLKILYENKNHLTISFFHSNSA